MPTFRVVQGRGNIYADIAQLIENSSGTIYISTTLEDISRMYHSAIPEKITVCEKRGGKVSRVTKWIQDRTGEEIRRVFPNSGIG